MMTYLDLVNGLILETGINGGKKIAGVNDASNTQEAKRIAGYVADADYQIQDLYNNWKFLWRLYENIGLLLGDLHAGQDALAIPTFARNNYTLRLIDKDSLVLRQGEANSCSPVWMEWRQFEKMYQRGVKSNSDSPGNWAIRPDGVPILSTKMVATQTNYRFECWARPQRMRSDGDVSPIVRALAVHPPHAPGLVGSNPIGQVVTGYAAASADNARDISGRIIICRAKIIHAEAEGALEIMQGSLAEYQDLLRGLQSTQLPEQEDDQASQADVQSVVVAV